MKKLQIVFGIIVIAILAFMAYQKSMPNVGSYFNQVSISDTVLGKVTGVTPNNSLRTAETYRLVGTIFSGTTLDPNFWTPTIYNGGKITQTGGEVLLSTDGQVNATSSYRTVRSARYIGASANMYRAQIQQTAGVTNNMRNWGAYSTTSGAFFKLEGTTMSVCTRKSSVSTCVPSTSWNSSSFTLDTNVHTYEIYMNNKNVWFAIDDTVVHKVTASTATWSDTLTLPVNMENYNMNGASGSATTSVRVATINRLGPLNTDTIYFRGTTAATNVLKYGAGTLHRITLNNPGGTLITVYDNTSAAGSVIAVIDTPATANPVTLEYNVPFSNGLTIVTTGTWDYTVAYE